MARRRLRLVISLLAAASLLAGAPAAGAQAGSVLLTEVEGPITPVVADQLQAAVERAAEDGHQALVVTLDTPGGLDASTRDIVQEFLNAPVPVVVYVSPEGARAASAGTFITMAAHVAAMAPATSIGAATPVDLGGGEITAKVINDAAAFAVAVAQRRGRDTGFAEDAVREGTSITAGEALERGVVDLVVDDLEGLLEGIDGIDVSIGGERVRLETADSVVERFEPGTFRRILARLADPNLAFVFMSLGTLAVIYEVANPGGGFAGIVGVILLVLAFFSLSVLPVQLAGIALLVLSVGLFVAELFVPGVGVLAAGGAIALVLAGLFLFEGPLGVSPLVLLPSALVLGIGSVLAGRVAWRLRRAKSPVGVEGLIGRDLVVTDSEGRRGTAFLDGAWWTVRPRRGELESGARATVVAVEGLSLIVEPEEEENEP